MAEKKKKGILIINTHCIHVYIYLSLLLDATSDDIYAACRTGDELFVKEWVLDPESDINTT